MQILKVLLCILVFNVSCQTQDARIADFQEDLGLEQAQTLNLLVSNFEQNLKHIYPSKSLDTAYIQLLKELKVSSFENWKMLTHIPDSLKVKYFESGLRANFYIQEGETRSHNLSGTFFQSLQEQAYYDKAVAEYCWVIQQSVLMPGQFASGMLEFGFNPHDFFHKRIMVYEFAP